MESSVYFCTNCRKRIDSVDELLFVENSTKGFCSDQCIIEFYTPMMEHFAVQYTVLAKKYGEEEVQIDDEEIFQEALFRPDEVWLQTNELKEEFYTHLLDLGDSRYYLAICSYFEDSPAFVFLRTVISRPELLQFYRKDMRIDSLEEINYVGDTQQEKLDLEDVEVPSEVIEQVELKKSELLAEMISLIDDDDDIPLEKHSLYEQYMVPTLECADEEFSFEDDAGDTIISFVKTFHHEQKTFFYIVLCLEVNLQGSSDMVNLPIIGLPSVSTRIYKAYARGNQRKSQVKN